MLSFAPLPTRCPRRRGACARLVLERHRYTSLHHAAPWTLLSCLHHLLPATLLATAIRSCSNVLKSKLYQPLRPPPPRSQPILSVRCMQERILADSQRTPADPLARPAHGGHRGDPPASLETSVLPLGVKTRPRRQTSSAHRQTEARERSEAARHDSHIERKKTDNPREGWVGRTVHRHHTGIF